MSSFYVYGFEKLEVYQSFIDLSIRVREIVRSFPKEEQFDLTRQLKRSIDSISANLAEGSGRASNLDQAHFTNIAYASGLESINHLNLASRLGFIDDEIYSQIRSIIDKILNQLNALYKAQIRSISNLKTRTKESD